MLGARGTAAHFAAPAAFLLAVTIAVVLVRSSFQDSPSKTATTTTSSQATTARTTSTRAHRIQAPRYYSVQSGDTLGAIAYRFHTTVEKLLALNPGIQPTAMHIGQRVRVG
ncbi:MAG: LysM peptidoglycan-binding domain-containing protein [Gaiellaceae bacterium]